LYTQINTEQEAAIGLLLSSGSRHQDGLSQAQIETISRTVVLCRKFVGHDVNELFRKIYPIVLNSEAGDLIPYAAALISDGFSDTLFAMCCETALCEGVWEDRYGQVLATIGLALGLESSDITTIIKTFIIRTKWNIEVVS
jgi:hypothetical protein